MGPTDGERWFGEPPSERDSRVLQVTCPSTEPQGLAEVGGVGSIPGRTHMHYFLSRSSAPLMDWGEWGVPQGTDPTTLCWVGGSIYGFGLQGTAFGKPRKEMNFSRDGACDGIGAASRATTSMQEAAVSGED